MCVWGGGGSTYFSGREGVCVCVYGLDITAHILDETKPEVYET